MSLVPASGVLDRLQLISYSSNTRQRHTHHENNSLATNHQCTYSLGFFVSLLSCNQGNEDETSFLSHAKQQQPPPSPFHSLQKKCCLKSDLSQWRCLWGPGMFQLFYFRKSRHWHRMRLFRRPPGMSRPESWVLGQRRCNFTVLLSSPANGSNSCHYHSHQL